MTECELVRTFGRVTVRELEIATFCEEAGRRDVLARLEARADLAARHGGADIAGLLLAVARDLRGVAREA